MVAISSIFLAIAFKSFPPFPPHPSTLAHGIHRSSLQSHAAIISQNLNTVSAHYTTHSHLFSSLAVFPYPSFPGKTQEPLLGQILRKKLEPEVEDWVNAGLEECMPAPVGDGGKRFEAQMELWNWAGRAANELARQHEWGGDFTIAEREAGVENVVTGLRRKLIDSDSEDGSSESYENDIKMEGGAVRENDDEKKKKPIIKEEGE